MGGVKALGMLMQWGREQGYQWFNLGMQKKVTFSEIKTTIKSVVAKYIYRKTERSPMIVPVIMNVN